MQDKYKDFWLGFADGFPKGIVAAGVGAMLFLLMLLVCGCRTQYVPMETVRTEYNDRVNTVTVYDSVTNDRLVYVNGDTVFVRQWRDRWHTREVHDTIVSVKTDSVAVPYPVERELSRWERVKMDFGGMMLGAVGTLALALAAVIVWLVRVKRRK